MDELMLLEIAITEERLLTMGTLKLSLWFLATDTFHLMLVALVHVIETSPTVTAMRLYSVVPVHVHIETRLRQKMLVTLLTVERIGSVMNSFVHAQHFRCSVRVWTS